MTTGANDRLDLTPRPGPASPARRALAQARFDAAVWLANGEQLLLTMILPLLVLVALVKVPGLDPGPQSGPAAGTEGLARVDVAVPGVLALAVMSAAFTGQAIGTAFDRRQGALRLLATTPLGRGGLLAGRALAVVIVEGVQLVVLGGAGLLFGWRPAPLGLLLLGPLALLLGTATFAALGLLLAGTLRSEAVLAAANLLWVLLLIGGGVVLPPSRLGGFATAAALLPSGALGEAARAAYGSGRLDLLAWGVLLAWLIAATAAATRWFRWDGG